MSVKFWRWAALLGLVAGVFVTLGLGVAMEWTNRTEFCISCHSMQRNYDEYRQSIHFTNRSGAHAQCADCHVPKALGPKLVRKVLALNDVVAELRGTIDTPEKFDARRQVLAEKVWAYMAASDSRECRSCHSFQSMNPAKQAISGRTKHAEAEAKGETCIACHKGVAHKVPASKDDL